MGMPRKINLLGQTYGKLTVISEKKPRYASSHKTPRLIRRWECLCECGKITVVDQGSLRSGNTRSCGCGCAENRLRIMTKPNEEKREFSKEKRLRKIIGLVKQRCINPNNTNYKNYGARGIKVCKEWQGPTGIDSFCRWALENGYEDNLTLDRINVDGDYEPSNCRWVSQKEQMNNTRVNHTLSYNGKTQSVTKWADEMKVSPGTLFKRIKLGWSDERVILTPVNTKFSTRRKSNE